MVETMESYFGSCTNHGECEAACPKEISIDFIALMNRDYVKAQFKNRKLTGQTADLTDIAGAEPAYASTPIAVDSGARDSRSVTTRSTSAWARAMRPRQSWISSLARCTRSGEHVDVEVVALELLEDVVELAHGVGVADLVGHSGSPCMWCPSR